MNTNKYIKMDGIKIFHLNDNKYYVFLEKYKNIIEANIRKNFFTIKNIEEPIIQNKNNENNENNLSLNEWEKMETLLQMAKHGFNKVYGWRFRNIHISIKNLETIKLLINKNYNFLKQHNLNTEWSKLLDISIENEKNRQSKTMCFLCCKKGHFAINCKEDYDIDGEYIGNQTKSKHNKKIIKKKYNNNQEKKFNNNQEKKFNNNQEKKINNNQEKKFNNNQEKKFNNNQEKKINNNQEKKFKKYYSN